MIKLDFLSSDYVKSIDDGKTHINVYSKGRTELGRLLSNFAHTPITIGDDVFQSVESWWYWKKLMNMNHCVGISVDKFILNRIKNKIGAEAKYYFRELYQSNSSEYNPTEEELKDVYIIKLEQHPRIKDMLLNNNLPLAHYYIMNDVKVHTNTEWTALLWCEIYEDLKNKL